MINRRGFLIGLITAPAIVRVTSIMPIRVIEDWELTLPLYGISPAMVMLPSLEELQNRIQRIMFDDLFHVINSTKGIHYVKSS